MLRKAAFASSVVASSPIVLPSIKPALPRHCATQVNTAQCVSIEMRRRVREIVEWSGGASCKSRPRKSRKCQRVRRSPRDAALRVDAFEVPDQQQPKIDARRQTQSAHRLGIKAGALRLDKIVEVMLTQQLIQTSIKRMARRRRQILGRHPYRWLPIALSFAHRHAPQCTTLTARSRQQLRRYTARTWLLIPVLCSHVEHTQGFAPCGRCLAAPLDPALDS